MPPVQFGYNYCSDGTYHGDTKIRFSLTSHDIIADSIEAAMGGRNVDAFVAIGGCDKNIPGSMITIANMDTPNDLTYGGVPLHQVTITVRISTWFLFSRYR